MHSQTRRSSAQFIPVRPSRPGQSALQEAANKSPQVAGMQALQAMAKQPLQRMDDEDLMQGKMMQRVEEEEELQMKPVQRLEEDELQGKFIQRMEDEELMQGKAIQRAESPKANNTGLPDNLKSGIENLSGMSMDAVKVHRNSDKPAQVQAHAYAQGTDIHLAPGQEQHLPHEAWHVVQQAQGRVRPTMQLKGVAVNDDPGLEAEADVMGAKAVQQTKSESVLWPSNPSHISQRHADEALQLVLIDNSIQGRAQDRLFVRQYHDAERRARQILLENGGNWTRDILTRAIQAWQNAADLRVAAGALHQDQDGGHLDAIAFCRNQVNFLSGLLATRRE